MEHFVFGSFEKSKFDQFMKMYKDGQCEGQRIGQAFHDFANLEFCSDKEKFDLLYQLDGEEAIAYIKSNFDLN